MNKSKTCSKCRKRRKLKQFNIDNRHKDGLQSQCKICQKEWKIANKDILKEYRRGYYLKDKDIENKRSVDWSNNNPEAKAKIDKRYRENHPEKHRLRRELEKELDCEYTYFDEYTTRLIFNNKCFKCQSKVNICVDHHKCLIKLNPLSIENAALLCKHCNSRKKDKNPEKFYNTEELLEIKELFSAAIELREYLKREIWNE